MKSTHDKVLNLEGEQKKHLSIFSAKPALEKLSGDRGGDDYAHLIGYKYGIYIKFYLN